MNFRMHLYLLLVFVSFYHLLSQETAPIFNRVPANEKGVEELTKLLSDPKVRIEDKEGAVDRLGVIARQIYAENKNFPPEKIYNPLLGALNPTNEPHHHVLRMQICRALAQFDIYDKGVENIIPALGRRLKDSNEHEDVRVEAGRSLGRFQKNRILASTELIDVLSKELERGPQPDNIRLMTVVIQSLGSLGDKRAFVPLMKVIKSSFPTGVKKEAQISLENIRWD
ncbi:MAG: HEAT repeat domain-containing protein [Leptonema sp. (in: bacteria)]